MPKNADSSCASAIRFGGPVFQDMSDEVLIGGIHKQLPYFEKQAHTQPLMAR